MKRANNGMLCHSLGTLEGEQDFIFFYRARLSRESPLSLYLQGFFLCLPLQPWACTLVGPRACRRDCNECMHQVEVQKKRQNPYKKERGDSRDIRRALQKNRRVCKQNSLKLQEILFKKNYGITLTRGNYDSSGRQIIFRVFFQYFFFLFRSLRLESNAD